MKYLVALIIFIGITACDNDDNGETNNPDVETYIDLLKTNQYDSSVLPSYTYVNIPALLNYRNESQMITDFPRNPISSFYQDDCKLGIYVLWTIESIRAVSINSEYLVMGFPSLNPLLALRDSSGFEMVVNDTSLTIVAKAYYDWWESNKDNNYADFKNTDPLEGTDYYWH